MEFHLKLFTCPDCGTSIQARDQTSPPDANLFRQNCYCHPDSSASPLALEERVRRLEKYADILWAGIPKAGFSAAVSEISVQPKDLPAGVRMAMERILYRRQEGEGYQDYSADWSLCLYCGAAWRLSWNPDPKPGATLSTFMACGLCMNMRQYFPSIYQWVTNILSFSLEASRELPEEEQEKLFRRILI